MKDSISTAPRHNLMTLVQMTMNKWFRWKEGDRIPAHGKYLVTAPSSVVGGTKLTVFNELLLPRAERWRYHGVVAYMPYPEPFDPDEDKQ